MGRLGLYCSALLLALAQFADAGLVGVNYGRVADNLPPPTEVVQLLKSYGIDRVKIFDTDSTVLKALSGTGISVTVTLPNQQLSSAASSSSFATTWVQQNIAAYHPGTRIEAIAVGNEVFVDPNNLTGFLVPAMKNIHDALVNLNLNSSIKVSSPIALSSLGTSYPPSSGSFKPELAGTMASMLEFLRQYGSRLMVNVYPFFAYESNSDKISLDYALFRDAQGIVDPNNGLHYFSLFDAQVDAVFAAMSALNHTDVGLVVTETGWPSMGDQQEIGAGKENAAAYNGNVARRTVGAGGGTPLKPQASLTVYLFALFNENQKPGPTSERNFGLFYPNKEKVYDLPFPVRTEA
ncbi:hypothetical protein CDL15_Pgr021569 [Punica granatum]|uniref:glucan endo-1,3-beta-D-glucosidase n=2 Tax=Punica granatum TaxID=22663 RepID=A0A218WRH7_PUNGR|nr:hypothetical protein CDL15_Pgr021569 [Punica granatum]